MRPSIRRSATLLATVGALVAGALTLAPAPADAQPSRAVFAYTFDSFNTVLVLTSVTGGEVTIAAGARGWVESLGMANGASAGNNYIAGICGSDACNSAGELYNNWFSFDIPTGQYTAAILRLDVPPGGSTPGYISTQPSETYTLWDVSTPIGAIGNGGVGVFADLGSGVAFGSRAYTAADMGTTTAITLNAAGLAAIQASAGQQFAVGGSLGIGQTNVVPEPSTYVLLGAGLAGVVGVARRRRMA